MQPGTYEVYLGAYRRSTGERLKVVERAERRRRTASCSARSRSRTLTPVIQQLIPPTHVDVMRKYPDRIVDSHRQPGS